MATLRRTPLFTAASRQPVIPGLGLPINITIWLFLAIVFTMALARGWRAWVFLFGLWTVLGFLARIRLQRDHNGFHVDSLWLQTKAGFLDAHLWRGVTLRSFPPRNDRFSPRGIPPRMAA